MTQVQGGRDSASPSQQEQRYSTPAAETGDCSQDWGGAAVVLSADGVSLSLSKARPPERVLAPQTLPALQPSRTPAAENSHAAANSRWYHLPH